jgi:excisionase family DNA binding protein
MNDTDTIAAILSHPAMTPRELCHVFKTGKQATYQAIARKEIPSFFVGGVLRIPTAWVVAQLQLGTTQAA